MEFDFRERASRRQAPVTTIARSGQEPRVLRVGLTLEDAMRRSGEGYDASRDHQR